MERYFLPNGKAVLRKVLLKRIQYLFVMPLYIETISLSPGKGRGSLGDDATINDVMKRF